jgi:hypothetical protein
MKSYTKDEHDRAVLEVGKRLAGQDIDDMPLFSELISKSAS